MDDTDIQGGRIDAAIRRRFTGIEEAERRLVAITSTFFLREDGQTSRVQANFDPQFGQTLKVAYEVNEDSTIIGIVRQGLGAIIRARLAAKPIPEDLPIFQLPVTLRVVGVAVFADALHPRSVFAFLKILK